ncbi:GHMP kinase [Nocardiopsis sp. MG754419]|uniref:GHMP family kinase ATP-binding protein n=1 Tax=Nocardiopsis sp. MG754419 TaxID=2259865 RepID=UPI001BA748FD|nr:GHMP kinase [Nocardiopsis sp. MG754419]MBR8743067.1 GHMP kinase [Nocardiopsis sp. MG754419]
MTLGTGQATCHHGEVLQGIFLDGRGEPTRGLVTLPMAEPATRAVFTPFSARAPRRVVVDPPDRAKAARAAELAVTACARRGGLVPVGGHLSVRGGAVPGLGMGSSTSDVTAAVRAVSAGLGVELPPHVVAEVAVAAEGASDPIMFGERPLLFAQRRGRVLEELGAALPELAVVGCLTGSGHPVDTLALRGTARAGDIAVYERLRAALRTAIAENDAAGLGRVCTESAILNQRVLPKDELGTLREAARSCGAVGIQVAHSGNVAGLLFDAAETDLRARIDAAVDRLGWEGLTPTRVFSTVTRTTLNTGERSWTTTFPMPSPDLI